MCEYDETWDQWNPLRLVKTGQTHLVPSIKEKFCEGCGHTAIKTVWREGRDIPQCNLYPKCSVKGLSCPVSLDDEDEEYYDVKQLAHD
jgi:hypothetical protein